MRQPGLCFCLQAVKLGVFFREIIGVNRGIKDAAGVFHDLGGLQQRAVLMYLFPQPCGDGRQITLAHAAPNVHILLHVPQHLGAVSAAQGVRGEIAEGAARPVAVLQAAALVVGDVDAKILFIQPVPLVGDGSPRTCGA